jgi:uncharacterized membrane protein YgdD (TMEM256/DUF423 family)
MAISIWIFGAALNGLLAVAAGAAASHIFGDDAHAVRLMSTGAQYAMYHALALLALAALAARTEGSARGIAVAAWLFLAGTVLFSGSLYLLAFTGLGAFASVTPVGGVAFLAGWAVLAAHGWRRRGVTPVSEVTGPSTASRPVGAPPR